jgi:hypothetical protein
MMQVWPEVTVTDKEPRAITPSCGVGGTKAVPPALKLAAVASIAGLRDSRGDAPLDAFVPVRTAKPPPTMLRPRSAKVLAQVDGTLALAEIAAKAELPISDTIEAYFDLLARGLVSAVGAAELPVVHAPAEPERFDEDAAEAETGVSDVITDFARLAVATSVPTLRGTVEWGSLSAREAWVVSLVSAGFSVQAILEVSPLEEGDTLTLLSKLIDARVIALRS